MNKRLEEFLWKTAFAGACFWCACATAAYVYQCGYFDAPHRPRYLTAYVRDRITRAGNVITVPFKKDKTDEPSQ